MNYDDVLGGVNRFEVFIPPAGEGKGLMTGELLNRMIELSRESNISFMTPKHTPYNIELGYGDSHLNNDCDFVLTLPKVDDHEDCSEECCEVCHGINTLDITG